MEISYQVKYVEFLILIVKNTCNFW